jgi:hypothetical protein
MIYTFYFKVSNDYTKRYKKGVYRVESIWSGPHLWASDSYATELCRLSDKVWRQDSTGEIKVIKDRHTGRCAYINQDEEQMKEFMWAKLQA